MLALKHIGPSIVVLSAQTPRITVGGGLFSMAFGSVMLGHPTGWTSGTMQNGAVQMADPMLMMAIGSAILLFGAFLAFGRTSYLVDHVNGLLLERFHLFVQVTSTPYNLSDFDAVTVDHSQATNRYELRVKGPTRVLRLDSARVERDLARSRRAAIEAMRFGKDNASETRI